MPLAYKMFSISCQIRPGAISLRPSFFRCVSIFLIISTAIILAYVNSPRQEYVTIILGCMPDEPLCQMGLYLTVATGDVAF